MRVAAANTKEKIRSVATDMLIVHGYRGMNFRLIAQKVGTTTTNIHYHFGGKNTFVEQLVDEYVEAAIGRQTAIWGDNDLSLREKLAAVAESNRERYLKYNKRTRGGRTWTLIGRLRMESDIISPRCVDALNRFTNSLNSAISDAVHVASASGELNKAAPLDNIATLLVGLVNSSAAFAMDAGFDQLEKLYSATADVIFSAYSSKA